MAIRNYNAFIREAKKKHGLTHKQSQRLYTAVTNNIGRSARKSDLRLHPRIIATAVKGIRVSHRKQKTKQEDKTTTRRSKRRSGAEAERHPRPLQRYNEQPITSSRLHYDEDYGDYDFDSEIWEEWAVTFEYE